MIKAVFFDLGGTLVEYFNRSEFPRIRQQAIMEVQRYLDELDVLQFRRNQCGNEYIKNMKRKITV